MEQDATSCSMTCTTYGNLSKMSDGCGLFDQRSISVFLTGADPLATCVARVMRAEEAIPSHAGTQDVQQASITRRTIPPSCISLLDHDEMSESVKESVERSGDILFIGVFWKDGYVLDMILQA